MNRPPTPQGLPEPDGFNGDGTVFKWTARLHKKIMQQREDLIKIAILEVEGKHATPADVKRYGAIHRQEGTVEELITWKGKPLIQFGETVRNDEGEIALQYKFLYE